MDLAVNEEFTRMYSEEELMGARRIQVDTKTGFFVQTYGKFWLLLFAIEGFCCSVLLVSYLCFGL